jgi:hypothetical protein
MLRAWWLALHGVVLAAFALLGAPWSVKCFALLATLAHATALRPRPTPRLVWHGDGRVGLPELGLDGLTLGPRTRHCGLWMRLDVRGAGRALDILLLADQLDAARWRTLRADLNRLRTGGAPADPGDDPRPDLR